MTLPAPIAVDAMGGDRAPDEIVAGAERAASELGLPVVLVGDPDAARRPPRSRCIAASEVIAMDADPAKSVRRMKDSSLVRAAEAVRDGRASAMVSAGNTGATWGAALLRMGRIKGVARPAIATPIPCPGDDTRWCCSTPGPTPSARPSGWSSSPRWARCSPGPLRHRRPRVGLLSIGEEPTKGDALVKETHGLLADEAWTASCGATFVGNVEGRDLMSPGVDVVVPTASPATSPSRPSRGGCGRSSAPSSERSAPTTPRGPRATC